MFSAWCTAAPPTKTESTRLPKGRDLFFAEHNLTYSRYLSLGRDGTYRQINQNRTDAAEADRGTWEQAVDGTVRLHSTYRGLRFRALLSGPLILLLDSVAKVAALPQTAVAIRRFLDESPGSIFPAAEVEKLASLPAGITLDPAAESFRRDQLEALAVQVAQMIQTEGSHTYLLTPARASGVPLLLVLQGATYPAAQIPEVCREYAVPRGAAPPFYFAQVDAAAFARRVGRWRDLQPVAGWLEP